MKRFWAAAALLLLLAGLAALHVSVLGRITGQLTGQLEQARQELIQEHWDQAQTFLDAAYRSWDQRGFYLHTTLRHTEIDDIRASFHEAFAYLSLREDAGECAAVCARLINQLELVLEAELPTLKNIL